MSTEDSRRAIFAALGANLGIAELADAIDATEVDVRAEVPALGLIYIEPDVRRAAD